MSQPPPWQPPTPPSGPQAPGSWPQPQQVTAPLPTVPQQKPFLKRPWVWGVAAALVVGIGIGNAGNGSDQADSNEAASTSTSSSAVGSTSSAPAPTTTLPPAPVAPTPSPTVAPPPVTASTPAGVDFAMPDLVGVDLQTAQNLIQTHGIFLSRSHDLLGSRNQVLDSNWIVCTQNIPVGQQVTGDAEGLIDLGVVKREETCP